MQGRLRCGGELGEGGTARLWLGEGQQSASQEKLPCPSSVRQRLARWCVHSVSSCVATACHSVSSHAITACHSMSSHAVAESVPEGTVSKGGTPPSGELKEEKEKSLWEPFTWDKV